MKNILMKKWLTALIPAFLVASGDILSKIYVINFMSDKKVFDVCNFFNLVSVYNKGISFSMFSSGGDDTKIILMGLSIFISLFIIFWIKKETSYFTVFCLGVILGGALGNLIDRICNGAVFDFLDFHIGTYHWPAFNVADSAVVAGVIALLIFYFAEMIISKRN